MWGESAGSCICVNSIVYKDIERRGGIRTVSGIIKSVSYRFHVPKLPRTATVARRHCPIKGLNISVEAAPFFMPQHSAEAPLRNRRTERKRLSNKREMAIEPQDLCFPLDTVQSQYSRGIEHIPRIPKIVLKRPDMIRLRREN